MGMLIQTKGTQFLAQFLTARFGAAFDTTNPANAHGNTETNLAAMRRLYQTAFTGAFSGASLYSISEAFLGQWFDGSDVFYPTATVTTGQALAPATPTILNFNNPLPNCVTSRGSTLTAIWDETTPGAIPAGATFTITGASQMTFSRTVTVGANDHLVFSNSNHPQLIKRWKFYLKNELTSGNNRMIESAILDGLNCTSCNYIMFHTIESSTQNVLRSLECYNITDTSGNVIKLDQNNKYMDILLQTPPTAATDSRDPQF